MTLLRPLFFALSIFVSQNSFGAVPDLSTLTAFEALKLGLNAVEKIDGHCYNIKHDFCQSGTPPYKCIANEELEGKTRLKLNDMKFVLSSRVIEDNQNASEASKKTGVTETKNQEAFVYKAVPKLPKQKEDDVYLLRGKNAASPIRLFLTLRESSCEVPRPSESSTPVRTAQPTTTLPSAPSSPTYKSGNTTPAPNISIPQTDTQRKAALKFLLQNNTSR